MDCKTKKEKSLKHQNSVRSRKKLKKSGNKNLDEAVFTWFKNVCSNNIPVNGSIIRETALGLAKILELTDIRASDGWLDKWKQRHNVTFKETL